MSRVSACALPLIAALMGIVSPAVLGQSASPPEKPEKPQAAKRFVTRDSNQLWAAATTVVASVCPPVARWASECRSVTVRLAIDEKGEVIDARADSGRPVMMNAAASAARGWRFRPAESDGKPAKVDGTLIVMPEDEDAPPTASPDGDRIPTLESMRAEESARAKEAVRRFPDSAEAYFWLGFQCRFDEAQQAEKAFKKAIELKPTYLEAYESLIGLYMRSKADADVLRTFQQAVDEIPNSPLLLSAWARELNKAKRYGEAIDAVKRALDIVPDELSNRYLLASLLLRTQHYDEALAETTEELKIDPGSAVARFNLAVIYDAMGRLEEAIHAYEYYIKNHADDSEIGRAHQNIGSCLARANRMAEAIAAFNRAVEIKHDLRDAYCFLGSAYMKESRMQEALAAFKKGVEEQPDGACAFAGLGNLFSRMGKAAEAESAYRKAVELDPGNPERYVELAGSLTSQNKQDQSAAVLRQGLARFPDDVPLHGSYGRLLEEQGKLPAAEVQFREVLRLAPNNPVAANDLGRVLMMQNEKQAEALELIHRAVRAEPGNESYLGTLGWAYLTMGKLEDAEHWLNEAAQGPEPSAATFDLLGDVYEKQGKHELALGAWKKGLALAKDAEYTTRLKAKLNGTQPKEK